MIAEADLGLAATAELVRVTTSSLNQALNEAWKQGLRIKLDRVQMATFAEPERFMLVVEILKPI